MTVPEVAKYLRISKSNIYYLVQRSEIPHIRIGRNVRIREKDLQKWLIYHNDGSQEALQIGMEISNQAIRQISRPRRIVSVTTPP